MLDEGVTLFEEVAQYETIGLLAHDYLEGAHFYELERFDVIRLRFDEYEILYQVEALESFSEFIDQDAIYDRMYKAGGLILQTCNGRGFFFVRAREVDLESCAGCEEQRYY